MDRGTMISSFSDDKLYRGHRRRSVLCHQTIQDNIKATKSIQTSNGGPALRHKKVVDIEGDGPLGIIFKNSSENMAIYRIINRTVASEFHEISPGMTVIKFNNIVCRDIGYFKSVNHISELWHMNGSIKLELEYDNHSNDDTNDDDIIYKFLKNHSCEMYYDNFVELGAKDEDDLLFIEEEDLIKMKLPILKHRRLWNTLHGMIVKNSESM